MCMGISTACVSAKIYLYTLCIWVLCPQTRKGHQIPTINGCEPSCTCWELNLSPLKVCS